MATTLNTSLRNQQADAWGTDLNSGFIKIYTGAQPAANDAPSGTLLVTIDLDADAYGAAASGSATALGTLSGVAGNTGTAGYAQQVNAAGTRWQYGSVTATGGGGAVQLDSISISVGNTVTITSSIITQEES